MTPGQTHFQRETECGIVKLGWAHENNFCANNYCDVLFGNVYIVRHNAGTQIFVARRASVISTKFLSTL
jgi:hypothetical protein